MSVRKPLTSRVVGALVALALPALPLAACDANAQRQQQPTSTEGDDYRLTMPVLRKALPVLYAPEAKKECAEQESELRDVRAMGVGQMEKLLDQCPPAKRGAAEAGISTRELAQVWKALTLAIYRMAEEENAKVRGGTATPLPPGALRDNVALFRQNEAELARFSGDSE